MPLNQFLPLPFFATAAVFGFSHNEWLAGILCGTAYQWLVMRKNRLGDAMTAHAITNFLLGVWIVWKRRVAFLVRTSCFRRRPVSTSVKSGIKIMKFTSPRC